MTNIVTVASGTMPLTETDFCVRLMQGLPHVASLLDYACHSVAPVVVWGFQVVGRTPLAFGLKLQGVRFT